MVEVSREGRSNLSRAAWNAGKILLVYGAAGPMIGLIVFAIGISAITVLGGQPGGLWLAPFFLIYGVLFAHFVGLPWALVAGIAAFLLLHLVGNRAWIGAASGLASFAIATAGGFIEMPQAPDLSTGAATESFVVAVDALMGLVHVASATACWFIVRPLIRV